ncbi:NUDIX domain-containing protein [bacterium]|nr:NUDIX domain-containing protein [bacterium]
MGQDTRKWGIRSARTVFETKWIRVRSYDAVAPTGADASYGLIQFKNLAIGVIPVDREGCTVLVGQDRFAFGRYSWEIPTGGGSPDVAPIDSARRELAEEARLSARNWLQILGNIHLSNSVCDERGFGFIAWDLEPDDSQGPDASEALSLKRVPFDEAVDMAASGAITDAFSLVILLQADHLLRTDKLPQGLAACLRAGQR